MDIQETSFGPKKYLAVKKSITTEQITDKQMYDEAGKKLREYMGKNAIKPAGAWSVLYFTWDEANKRTDVGIGFPVESITSTNDPELSIVDVPESTAAMAVLKGSYSGLGQTHQALMEYSAEFNPEMKNVPVMAIEEYIVDPMSGQPAQNYLTNIYYLHN